MPQQLAAIAQPGLGLPPVVDHRPLQLRLGPLQRVRIAALAGEEQGAKAGQIVLVDVPAVGVLLLDRPERGRRGEQADHAVLGDHPPERAGIGRADRLTLVHDRGVAVQQRRVADVAVADHPADVGGRPVHLAGRDVVHVLHAPAQRHGVAAVVAHDALGLAGGARGIENVQRVGRSDRDAFDRRCAGRGFIPVEITARRHRGLGLRARQHDALLGLVRGVRDRAVQQRLVRDHPARLDAAGRRDQKLGRGVVDARRQLVRREAAEHDGMDRTDARAPQHGDQASGTIGM